MFETFARVNGDHDHNSSVDLRMQQTAAVDQLEDPTATAL